jgi:hypothetical protein
MALYAPGFLDCPDNGSRKLVMDWCLQNLGNGCWAAGPFWQDGLDAGLDIVEVSNCLLRLRFSGIHINVHAFKYALEQMASSFLTFLYTESIPYKFVSAPARRDGNRQDGEINVRPS